MSRLKFVHSIIDPCTPGAENDICVVGDIDGDGREDIIIGGKRGRDNLVWYRAPDWQRFTIGTASLEAGGVLVDLTGNGRLDLIAGQHGDLKELYWFEQPEDPTQPWPRYVIEEEFAKYHDQAVGDVDGDGEPEILIASQGSKVLCYYDIPADPRVSPWPRECRHIMHSGESFEGLAVADLDGDGRQEVVAGPNVWRLAAGRWQRQRIADFKDPVVALGDLTGTGRLDIVLAEGESYPARLAWFEAPDWKMHLLADDLFHPHSLAVADFDGDGRLDIMVGEMGLGRNPHPKLMIYLNKGGGAFEPVVIDRDHATHHARVIHLEGHGLASIVGKPYQPGNQVDLWTNVTQV